MHHKICFFGDTGIDEYPKLGIKRPGGCSLNAAVNLSLTGSDDFEATLLGVTAHCAEAQEIKNVCKAFEINHLLKPLNGPLPRQVISHTPKGEKIFDSYDPGILALLQVDPDTAHGIKTSDAVVTVVFDQFQNHLEPIISCKGKADLIIDFMDMKDFHGQIDIVKRYSDHLEVGFFGLDAKEDRDLIGGLESLSKQCRALFVITLGRFGSLAIKDGTVIRATTEEINPVIDSTGAGDAFLGAFLSRYFTGTPLKQALEFSNHHAGQSLGVVGAFPWPL